MEGPVEAVVIDCRIELLFLHSFMHVSCEVIVLKETSRVSIYPETFIRLYFQLDHNILRGQSSHCLALRIQYIDSIRIIL